MGRAMYRWSRVLIVAAMATCVVVGAVFILGRHSERHNILLISVDTLGAKHMGCYGHFRDTSPNMDALAGEGVLFTRAISPSPWTLPSHVSIFTSLYPATHKVSREWLAMDPTIQTLAEVLHDHGYTTAGYVDSFLVSSRFGFAKGFDLYDDKRGGIEQINEKVRSWLANRGSQPFFLFYHVFDVHCPYTPPAPYLNLYSQDYQGPSRLLRLCGVTEWDDFSLSNSDIEYVAANYDADVRYTDEHLGELFQMLETFGLSENTIVVLLSDHGEELMEHGRIGHGTTLYDEVLRVPLIIRIPNEPAPGRRIDHLVRLIDVAPTLLDLVGIEPPSVFQGISLVPLLRGDQTARLTALAETEFYSRLRHSLYQDGHHFILSTLTNEMELYDLGSDLLEQKNLVHNEGSLTHAMEAELHRMLEQAQAAGSRYQARSLVYDEEHAKQLRALGYAD